MSETARLLNMSERSVRRYIDAGRIPAYKLPGGWRVRESELEAFLERHRAQPVAENQPVDLTAQLSIDEAATLAELGQRLRRYLDALRDGEPAVIQMYRGSVARALAAVVREVDEATGVEATVDVLAAVEEGEAAATQS